MKEKFKVIFVSTQYLFRYGDRLRDRCLFS